MNKSRLIVFQLKEIIYTLIFIVLGLILIIVLFNMFNTDDDSKDSKQVNASSSTTYLNADNSNTQLSQGPYTPGIYATTLNFGEQSVNLEVTVDQQIVKDITLQNLSDTVLVSYPLLEPSVEYIETELSKGTPLTDIKCDNGNRYTHSILVETISTMLAEAKK